MSAKFAELLMIITPTYADSAHRRKAKPPPIHHKMKGAACERVRIKKKDPVSTEVGHEEKRLQ